MIEDRIARSHFPRGGSKFYSSESVSIPTIPVMERGPLFSTEWPNITRRMIEFGNRIGNPELLQFGDNVKGQRAWVYFPGGYREFRKEVGKKYNSVNLNLTGQTLSDMFVRTRNYQKKGFIGARQVNGKFVKGKVGSGNKVIAKLDLKIEMRTEESAFIAEMIERGKSPRPFRFFTDSEADKIAELYTELIRSGLSGKDISGVFRKYGF